MGRTWRRRWRLSWWVDVDVCGDGGWWDGCVAGEVRGVEVV